ncbi:MAG: hypothetical protein ABDH49_08045 [Candidatus Hydrothermales bacterium]
MWVYSGIRPSNYPEKRIKGISYLLSSSLDKGLVIFFKNNILSQIENKNPRSSLRKIMNFQGIGLQRKEEMFFNIIMPFMLALNSDPNINNFLEFLFDTYPPLKYNSLIKKFLINHKNIKIKTVKDYMGVIFLMKS